MEVRVPDLRRSDLSDLLASDEDWPGVAIWDLFL